jgi:hypothetical protein
MQDFFTINIKVQAALEKLFLQHRLVFWYDEKAEMTGLFNSLEIDGVEKMVIENNEFTLKHQLLIELNRVIWHKAICLQIGQLDHNLRP